MADAPSDLRLFRAIAVAGSLAAAAPELGLSASAVSRRLAALEDRLGVRLAERGSRRFTLTPEGELYRKRCEEILDAIHAAEEEVAGGSQAPRGVLRIGAPMELGRRYVAPLVAQFRARHHDIQAHLALGDLGWEVGRDKLDVALRVSRPDDPGIIARRIAAAPRIVCAAPAYIARRGMPRTPEELGGHDCLVLERRDHLWDEWRFSRNGRTGGVRVSGPLSSESGDVLHQWALEGLGLSCEAYWDVAEDLARGRLVECLPGYRGDDAELFATYLPGRHMPARVRVFMDYIAEATKVLPTR